ncbi:MAG: hypothetical protein U1A27_04365 [Phycisphaerae bacterium]
MKPIRTSYTWPALFLALATAGIMAGCGDPIAVSRRQQRILNVSDRLADLAKVERGRPARLQAATVSAQELTRSQNETARQNFAWYAKEWRDEQDRFIQRQPAYGKELEHQIRGDPVRARETAAGFID